MNGTVRMVTTAGLLAVGACAGGAPGRQPAVLAAIDTMVAGERSYRLVVPAGTPAGAPLVVWLHGCTQDAAALAQASRMDSLARAHSLIVVYPEQPATANQLKCWNWFLPGHQGRGAGEPAIIAAIATGVAERYGADPRRVFIGGLSAGGAMAVVTAIAYPDVFAAAASHSGIGWRMATDVTSALAVMKSGGAGADSLGAAAVREMGARARPIPLFALHGMKDVVAAPAASRALVAQFAAIARAAGMPTRADTARGEAGGYAYTLIRHRGARDRVLVEAWL